MAKIFYSLEEVEQKLGKSVDEVKQLVEDGQLREFRDGAKILFKINEVDALASDGGSSDEPDFDLGGSSEIGLASLGSSIGDVSLGDESPVEDSVLDSTDFNLDVPEDLESPEELDLGGGPGDTGSEIGLMPMDTGSQAGLRADDSADKINLDDTSQGAAKDDTVITEHGVEVLDDSGEMDFADPMAQTQLAPDLDDHVNLDSGSSGSGLLDLTREADDTSLGAELLDEIYPGQEAGQGQAPGQLDLDVSATRSGSRDAETMEAQQPMASDFGAAAAGGGMQMVPAVVDPTSDAYGAALVIPFLVLIYLAFLTGSAMRGVSADGLLSVSDSIWYILGGAAVLTVVVALVGSSIAASAGQPKTVKAKKTKAPKAPKSPKAKKAKK